VIIALAIPVFFALIGVELLVAHLQGRRDLYRFSDAITALSCGIGSQVSKVFLGAALVGVYWAVWELARPLHEAIVPWGPFSGWAWVVALLAVDHQYYWWHRHSHRINILWAAHVVHHQSQEYNLAVALRQALFTSVTSLPYYLPLAVLGVHPVVFALAIAINTLYQFWIHTRTVGRLGPLEWVLNTPSHHRVHHGINPEYIDKNHAGMLIVWDRLYGTFIEEGEEPVYGTVQVLDSYDPIWANFAYWGHLWRLFRRARTWRDRLYVWVAPPEWTPEGPKPIPPVDRATYRKWDVPLARGVGPYVAVHFIAVATPGIVWLLWASAEGDPGFAWLGLLATNVLWATWSWSLLFHRSPAAIPSEILRNLSLAPSLAVLLLGSPWLGPLVGTAFVLASGSIAAVLTHRRVWTAPPAPARSRRIAAAIPAR
jgi:alkylglycerol monooxygenase